MKGCPSVAGIGRVQQHALVFNVSGICVITVAALGGAANLWPVPIIPQALAFGGIMAILVSVFMYCEGDVA